MRAPCSEVRCCWCAPMAGGTGHWHRHEATRNRHRRCCASADPPCSSLPAFPICVMCGTDGHRLVCGGSGSGDATCSDVRARCAPCTHRLASAAVLQTGLAHQMTWPPSPRPPVLQAGGGMVFPCSWLPRTTPGGTVGACPTFVDRPLPAGGYTRYFFTAQATVPPDPATGDAECLGEC